MAFIDETMDTSLSFLSSTTKLFHYYKSLGDKSLEQIEESHINFKQDPESNSIGTLIHHMSGNMLSRFTDFLTADGEKAWRNREAEFERGYASMKELREAWEKGWNQLFSVLATLRQEDLDRTVYIRNEGHTVVEALQRQLAHYAYHVGQIVFLAKSLRGSSWKSLSIPKGGSATFNAEKLPTEKTKRHFTDKG